VRSQLLVLALVAAGLPAGAQSFIYNDFSSVAGLQINGNSSQQGNKLRLTPAVGSQAGSTFSNTLINLGSNASFSTFFRFEILSRGGLGDGADGLTFTVQRVASTVGGGGGGLGYAGINNSVAVEFDTFDNGETGGSNHVGIDTNGDVNSIATTGLLTPDFDNGNIWNAWVDYDGITGRLSARWSQSLIRPIAEQLGATLNLTTILGASNAYVGFTAGTGAGWGEHNILSWEFRNSFTPIVTIPEPATVSLLGFGLLGLVIAQRRRTR
jgi:hypothetical protein